MKAQKAKIKRMNAQKSKCQEPEQDMSRRPRGNRASVGQSAPKTKARPQEMKGQKVAGNEAPKG